MKIFLILAGFLSANAAMANPFDSFVGEYSLVGKPVIEKTGNARECVRFAIESMIGFSVTADTKGYQQTHVLHFNFDGKMGRGWMGHPVMEYNYTDDFRTGGSYAKTTGDANLAQNELTLWTKDTTNPLLVSLGRSGNQIKLVVDEKFIRKAQLESRCLYQITLVKK
ncbi:MAG: hypothetical protein ACXWQO_02465 [Bdellovibrionota bacterium]